jgi:hypothetical protein
LNAGIHPTQLRMLPILVNEQTFAGTLDQVEVLGLAITVHIETVTGFDTGQGANGPVGDLILGSDGASDEFLVQSTAVEIADRPAEEIASRAADLTVSLIF